VELDFCQIGLPFHIAILLFMPVDDDKKRVAYKTAASYSDDESSFEQVRIIQLTL
jgi:hypothetical protein